jgi:hypothetical protein
VSIAEHAVGEVLAVSEATEEQSRAGGHIVGEMCTMRDMARQITQNMEKSITFVNELAELSDKLKNLVESMGSDRRGVDRIPVDGFYTIALSGGPGGTQNCRLLDINRTGMRVDAAGWAVKASAGTVFRVHAAKGQLAGLLNGISAKCIWEDSSLCGIEFSEPLRASEGDLAQAVYMSSGTNI